MADQSPSGSNTVNKPGTSCLGCRRRKLKCDRASEGCHNCKKSDLPCVYPAPETGLKRKRGPYKKDKPPRERHLEDLVKYLEPKNPVSTLSPGSADTESPGGQTTSSGQSRSPLNQAGYPSTATIGRQPPQAANSEELVKDALVALSRSGLADHKTRYDDGGYSKHVSTAGQAQIRHGNPSKHPSPREIYEYWHIFVARVDPMTKVIHCPTFSKRLFGAVDNLNQISPSLEAMMLSVCFAALSTCTAREVRSRFGEAQDALTMRYGHQIETLITGISSTPDLEGLQALVIYLICIRGKEQLPSLVHLFGHAVRMAEEIGLGDDPEGRFSPLEAELRRRLWYHLCGLERRTAEESGSRNIDYLKGRNVQLPKNLNDSDLDPRMDTAPEPRQGVTDITLPILRFEVHKLIFGLWNIRKEQYGSQVKQEGSGNIGVVEQQNEFLETSRAKLDKNYMQHMHTSRPYDWLCSMFVQGMIVKARLIIDFPYGSTPTKEMPESERMQLLRASVEILQCTHGLGVDERISDWNWYFRGYVQWHSLAIVVAELGWSKDSEFAKNAWQVLDPVLSDWARIYERKRGDPAWDHVNTVVERARKVRQARRAQGQGEDSNTFKRPRTDDNSLPPIQQHAQQHPNTLPPMAQMHQTLPFHHYNNYTHGSNSVPSPSAVAGAQASPPPPLSSGVATPGSYGSLAPFPYTDASTPLDYNNNNAGWQDHLLDMNMNYEGIQFNAFNQVFADDVWLDQSWDLMGMHNHMVQSGSYQSGSYFNNGYS